MERAVPREQQPTGHITMQDLAVQLQELAKGEISWSKMKPADRNLLTEFEEQFWDFDTERYDALYQVVLDRGVDIGPKGRVQKQSGYTIKFVAWKDEEGKHDEIEDMYPNMLKYLRYDANKIDAARDNLEDLLGYRPEGK